MKTRAILSIATAVLLLGAAVAFASVPALNTPVARAMGLSDHADHGGHGGHGAQHDEHMGHHAQVGMDRPDFAPAEGSIPTADQAQALQQVQRLIILSDDDFTPATGVRSGSGTLEDPFVISGYAVSGDLYLGDTDACVVIKENWIDGQLSLNWNGQCVHVHHNYIRDLRVNENIHRTGYATGGLLEHNKITVVGQLRHYDGEFRENTVGPFEAGDIFDTVLETTPLLFAQGLVANVDGFNQGLIHHNTFYGTVDLDLHGHHHGTGFYAPHSHYHGDDTNRSSTHHEDHTDRWTSVAFTDNVVIDEKGYGLRYEDQNHAGDDRTANSESIEMLEEDHQHHTAVEISRNTVEGGGIWIDVFNADDQRHYTRNPGWLNVTDNKVKLVEARELIATPFFQFRQVLTGAITVGDAKEFELLVAGNTLEYVASGQQDPIKQLLPFLYYDEDPAAIDLRFVRDAKITVRDNKAQGFAYGVRAQQMDEMTNWTVQENDFAGAQHAIWYDGSVANRPVTDEEATQEEHHGSGDGQAAPRLDLDAARVAEGLTDWSAPAPGISTPARIAL